MTDMTPLVSVIVPVYNVARHLDRCMESLVAQTYRNLEIILVDDGSTDGSSALCEKWASEDSRIVVVHKENGGLSDARNVGTALAGGSYVGYVDSDDYVAVDMYETLVNLMDGDKRCLAICGVADVYPDRIEAPEAFRRAVMTPAEALSDIFLNKTLMVGIPPRLYPAWLAKEVLNPVGKTHEDAFVVVDQISRVERVVVDTTPRYFYCHNEGTITTMPSTRALTDNVEAWERNRTLVEKDYPELLSDVLFRCYWAHFDVLDGMILSRAPESEEKREMVSYLRMHKADILAHPTMSSKRKIAVRVLSASERAYELLVRIQNRNVKYC